MQITDPNSPYMVNPFTKRDFFSHGSKGGIMGDIMPISSENSDFGVGFYIGTNEGQAKSLVLHHERPVYYKIRIPKDAITKENTIHLTKDEWIYFVLYNRGYLDAIKNTAFYNYISHLADNKQFIVGPIADDNYNKCMRDFRHGNITDYTFKQIIDGFGGYGLQIVAKTQEACAGLIAYEKEYLRQNDYSRIPIKNKLSRDEKDRKYEELKEQYSSERKGLFIGEIFKQIRNNTFDFEYRNTAKYNNLRFPDEIHGEGDQYEYGED